MAKKILWTLLLGAFAIVALFTFDPVGQHPFENPFGGTAQAEPGAVAREVSAPAPVVWPPTATAPIGAMTPATVLRVVDGDTLLVDIAGEPQRVRLIGIDTPESVKPNSPVECFGPEASAELSRLVGGRQILLEADATQGDADQYDRLLRFVWLQDGGSWTNVNLRLVASGHAVEYTDDDSYAYQATFQAAEAQARSVGTGLWGAC